MILTILGTKTSDLHGDELFDQQYEKQVNGESKQLSVTSLVSESIVKLDHKKKSSKAFGELTTYFHPNVISSSEHHVIL